LNAKQHRCEHASATGRLLTAIEIQEQARDRAERGLEPTWQLRVYEQFRQTLEHDDFPCLFARMTHRQASQYCGFIPSLSDGGLIAFKDVIDQYLDVLEDSSEETRVTMPLCVFVAPESEQRDLDFYHQHMWAALQHLHDTDPEAWPNEIPRDPEHHLWTFCYRSVQLFVNFSAPAHLNNRSRNLGDAPCFVINPRKNFDRVAGQDANGRRVREVIRLRVAKYNEQPPSKSLGTYGDVHNREWTQYAAAESNDEAPSGCPLHIQPKASGCPRGHK